MKWDEFKARYFVELDQNRQRLQPLIEAIALGTVTLVYASRDRERNEAVALREYIGGLIKGLNIS